MQGENLLDKCNFIELIKIPNNFVRFVIKSRIVGGHFITQRWHEVVPVVHSSEKNSLKLLELKTPIKNCSISSQRLLQTRTTWSWSCWERPPCQRQRSGETFEYWTAKELFEVDIGISRIACDLVVIAVWGVSPNHYDGREEDEILVLELEF